MNLNLLKNFINKLKPIGTTIFLILLMLCWGVIPSILIEILNINKTNLSDLTKIIFTLFFDIIFIILIFSVYLDENIKDLKEYFNKNFKKNIKQSIKYWLIGLSIMIASNLIISLITSDIAGNEEAVREMIDKFPLYMAFQVIIYAPLTEEIIFRKSIRKITNNKYLYILLSGLIFGSLHVISSITTPLDWLYLIPYSALGFTFAISYTKTNNIFSTIVAHAIHNTLAFILYIL